MLNPNDFKNAIKVIDALGSSPAVLANVSKMAQDPNTDLEAMTALLKKDGSLAADIIRISNSALYAPATLHGSLTSAVNHIGLMEVIRVVNLSLARQLFARDLCSYGVSAYDYWSGSVATALLMEGLAKQTGLNSEDAYMIGILHSIGRVLINHVIETKGFSIFWDTQEPIEAWERDAVGFDYAEAGAMLLEHWHFPAPMCEVIRSQLKPASAEEEESLLGLLQFAQRLLTLTGMDFKNEDWHLFVDDPFVLASGLTEESVFQLIATCRDDFEAIRQSIKVS